MKAWQYAALPLHWLLQRFFAWMPEWARERMGRFFGWLIYTSIKRRWRITNSNLEICFPELSTEEREAMAREHFRNFALALIDFLILPVRSPAFWHRRFTIRGMEHLDQVRAEGRGAPAAAAALSVDRFGLLPFCPPGADGRGLFRQILALHGAHALQNHESVL